MDTTIAQANALHRLLRQCLLPTRPPKVAPWDPEPGPVTSESFDTLPMLYRSEAFAEDLLESHPALR